MHHVLAYIELVGHTHYLVFAVFVEYEYVVYVRTVAYKVGIL